MHAIGSGENNDNRSFLGVKTSETHTSSDYSVTQMAREYFGKKVLLYQSSGLCKDIYSFKGSIFYEDGSIYVGEVFQGRFQGSGTMNFSTHCEIQEWKGCVYTGDWFDNLPHGKGIMIYPDKKVIMGEFREGKCV